MDDIELFCCGIIPLKEEENKWQALVVKHVAGNYWAFPKGKQEAGESNRETATRELFEETGLEVEKFLSDEIFSESYFYIRDGKNYKKKVVYFIAHVKGTVKFDPQEIKATKWVSLFDLEKFMTFKEGKEMAKKTQEFIVALEKK